MNKDKDKLIKAKMEEYASLFSGLDPDRLVMAEKLYSQAAFMDVTLDSLQDEINEVGPITVGTNGNGFTVRSENPAQKSYNQMIRNYNMIIKTLTDLLPDDSGEDELERFRRERK